MNPEDTARFKECIRDAIDAIEEAQGALDLRSKQCPTCGATRFKTYPERLVANRLGGVLTKLDAELYKSGEKGGADAGK